VINCLALHCGAQCGENHGENVALIYRIDTAQPVWLKQCKIYQSFRRKLPREISVKCHRCLDKYFSP